MRIMITGGSGYIGKYVVAEMSNHHDVTIVDIKPPKEKGVEFVKCDVTKLNQILEAMKNIEAVVHLAGGIVRGTPYDIVEVNTMGTFNVLEAAVQNNVEKVVHASSDSALGFVFSKKPFSPEYFPIDEKHPLKPQDPYGLAKLMAEKSCKSFSRGYGIQTVCLRHCLVFNETCYANYQEILKEKEANVRRMWGYVDVRDVAQAYRLALEAERLEHEAFYISAENTFTKTSSLELIRKHYPKVKKISNEYLKEEHKALFDITKAKKTLGFQPKYNYEDYVKL